MDNNNTKSGKLYLRFDPKKTSAKDMAKTMAAVRRAARKAKGLPDDTEESDTPNKK